FDIFRNSRKYSGRDTGRGEFRNIYERETTGGTVRFGLPVTEALTTQFAYNYTQEEYDPLIDPNDMSDYISAAIGEGKWVKSSISASLIYNTLDNPQLPREGIFANL